jgi:hypothetical protein
MQSMGKHEIRRARPILCDVGTCCGYPVNCTVVWYCAYVVGRIEPQDVVVECELNHNRLWYPSKQLGGILQGRYGYIT